MGFYPPMLGIVIKMVDFEEWILRKCGRSRMRTF
jgi:hypothetical protein